MIGKVWIIITAFSLITIIHHARSACMPNDIKTHLDDELLEEHMFEIKVFSPETKEHELLSVINTLCSTWTRNKNKDENKLRILLTFKIMLNNFFPANFEKVCANLRCTEAYTVSHLNVSEFGDMYRRSCDGPISDLKCPSKSKTTISPNIPAVESQTSKYEQILRSTKKTFSGVLAFSLLLNVVLFLLVLRMYNCKCQ